MGNLENSYEDGIIIDTICAGCDLFKPVNDLSLCDECFAKLERDLIRSRDWEYSATAFAVPEDQLEALRDRVIREQDLQQELVQQAGSRVNANALAAIDMMRKRGWLFGDGVEGHTEGLLKGADLSNADLNGADLSYADLSGADLIFANLSHSELWSANFSGANLRFANLKGANLIFADLSGTDLHHTNLHDTFVWQNTRFDEDTILPDESHWSAERDLADFGAETRAIAEVDRTEHHLWTYTFADNVIRRYRPHKGWLDDKDGNPVDNRLTNSRED